MKATYHKYILNFKRPSGTSRGVMTEKETWFIVLEKEGKKGIGECGILRGLSVDDRPDYEEKLQWTCNNIHLGKDQLWEALLEFPSIQFGVEMAFQSLGSEDSFLLFPSDFTNATKSIFINGLVWMGEEVFMKQQMRDPYTGKELKRISTGKNEQAFSSSRPNGKDGKIFIHSYTDAYCIKAWGQ